GKVALLPVTDQFTVKRSRPRCTAFKEPKPQPGKSDRNSAHEQRLADRFRAGGEISDMVVDVVGNRSAATPSIANRVKGGRYLELDALSPERIVVVFAVESEGIHPV